MNKDVQIFPHNALSDTERNDLTRHESTIERGIETAKWGLSIADEALREIRDRRLYRETHARFEAYCQERWGLGRNYADKRIAFLEVVENLGTRVPILPATEKQARALTRLEPDQQVEAWQQALAQTGKDQPSAREVASVVTTLEAKLAASQQREKRLQRQCDESNQAYQVLVRQLENQEPEKIEVIPADYELLKAQLDVLKKDLTRSQAERQRLIEEGVRTKLKEQQDEINHREKHLVAIERRIAQQKAVMEQLERKVSADETHLKGQREIQRLCLAIANELYDVQEDGQGASPEVMERWGSIANILRDGIQVISQMTTLRINP